MAAMDIDAQPQPYTFDPGCLLITDANPLPSLASNKEETLSRTAQNCAQALISQLLQTCPIKRSEGDGALQLTLPEPTTQLPREKAVPKDKEKTKWEKFADKKGIKAKRKDAGTGKMMYDEAKGDWVPKYGYKGKKEPGTVDGDWLVEVDENAERRKAEGGEKEERREKKMKARKAK